MKNILWDGKQAVATKIEGGEWIITDNNGYQMIVSDEEYKAEQSSVSEDIWGAYEDAYADGEMDELDEDDTYDYVNCFVKESK